MEVYIARNGQRSGPFPLEEVQRQLASGQLQPGDLAWTEGARDWVPLASFLPLQSTPYAAGSTPPASPLRNLNSDRPVMGTGPVQTSGAAIASLVLGILAYLLCPLVGSIAAIICGHIARGNIRESRGTLSGEGMALAGLILGYSSFVVPVILIFAGIALPVFSEVQLRGNETKSLVNGKQIVTACRLYATDHGGQFPAKLDELVPKYLPDGKPFTSPLSPGESMAYEYFGGTENDPPDRILLLSKFQDRRGKRIIIHVDSSGLIGIPPANLPEPLPQ